jgi:hypothetical protein
MQQVFICDPMAIELKINTLVETSVSDDGWNRYFRNSSNDETWFLTFYESEYHGGGKRVLKKLPILTTSELIEIAICSTNEDEVCCASLELLEQEKINSKDFRIELLKKLESFKNKDLSDFDKHRIKLIIIESQLADSTNRREITNKSYDEVLADANYFRDIANEAKKIL